MGILSFFKRDTPEVKNAKALLKAIDRGGIPSNPIKVNDIARRLGLTVSTSAPMAETIKRIRAAVST
jgi:DNA-binding IclR family transcriptional regulator